MLLIKGNNTGTVISKVLTSSKNVPSNKYKATMAKITIHGDNCQRSTKFTKETGNWVSTIKREKTNAPMTMKNSMAEVCTVSTPASQIPRQPKLRVATPITMAAKEATAAASVTAAVRLRRRWLIRR
jgi:hypothetical protein